MIPLLCLLLGVFVSVSLGQSDGGPDPNSLRVVRNALAERSVGHVVIHSFTQKQVWRLGDGVTVALLKILDEGELNNPERVREYLPIIQAAFDHPQFIESGPNRSPTATLGLLNHLQQNLADASLQQAVFETVKFIKRKTSSPQE